MSSRQRSRISSSGRIECCSSDEVFHIRLFREPDQFQRFAFESAWREVPISRSARRKPGGETMPTLHIHLLGEFRLFCDEAPVSTVNTPRLQALLAYLLLQRDAPQPRHHLAFLFWPDTNEAQARTNLRQLLHGLKQTLPEADLFVHTDAQTV